MRQWGNADYGRNAVQVSRRHSPMISIAPLPHCPIASLQVMHPLARRVGRTIARRGLYSPADRVAVALSGGPDSVALTWILRELEAAWRRGCCRADSRQPPAARPRVRRRRGVLPSRSRRGSAARSTSRRVDVAALARARRVSIEAAARVRALPRASTTPRARLGATVVATGHTLDDQAETVLCGCCAAPARAACRASGRGAGARAAAHRLPSRRSCAYLSTRGRGVSRGLRRTAISPFRAIGASRGPAAWCSRSRPVARAALARLAAARRRRRAAFAGGRNRTPAVDRLIRDGPAGAVARSRVSRAAAGTAAGARTPDRCATSHCEACAGPGALGAAPRGCSRPGSCR